MQGIRAAVVRAFLGLAVWMCLAPAAALGQGEYVIGGGDSLQVNVWKNAELSQNVVVRPDGQITLPLIRDVKAQGLTALELGKAAPSMRHALVEMAAKKRIPVLGSPVRAGPASRASLGLLLAIFTRAKDTLPIGLVIYTVTRTFLNSLRSVEAVIMAIVFVIAVGIGPFAGVMALGLHTIVSLATLLGAG